VKRLLQNPLAQFVRWFEEAKRDVRITLPEAMCLSTIDSDGYPDSRMVLLKQVDHQGFVFYTDRRSRKGQALSERPRASLTFHWAPLKRQVRVQGETKWVTDQEADEYFKTRPRLSQMAAWVSKQSRPLESRASLVKDVTKLLFKYVGRDVPRPPYWTGVRVIPRRIEFWVERPNRLHFRMQYIHQAGLQGLDQWKMCRLYP